MPGQVGILGERDQGQDVRSNNGKKNSIIQNKQPIITTIISQPTFLPYGPYFLHSII
jgi:hypothetical protein